MSNERVPHWAWLGSAIVLVLAFGTLAIVQGSARPAAVPAVGGPDLVILSLTMTPASPQEGDVLQINATVKNQGDLAAWAATIDLTDTRPNGNPMSAGQGSLSAPLNPLASVVVTISPFLAAITGDHVLVARITGVTPSESDSANNEMSIQMSVTTHANGGGGDGSPSDGIRIEALEMFGVAGLIVVVFLALAGFAIGAAFRGRSRESLVPPPPEPPDEHPPPIWPP